MPEGTTVTQGAAPGGGPAPVAPVSGSPAPVVAPVAQTPTGTAPAATAPSAVSPGTAAAGATTSQAQGDPWAEVAQWKSKAEDEARRRSGMQRQHDELVATDKELRATFGGNYLEVIRRQREALAAQPAVGQVPQAPPAGETEGSYGDPLVNWRGTIGKHVARGYFEAAARDVGQAGDDMALRRVQMENWGHILRAFNIPLPWSDPLAAPAQPPAPATAPTTPGMTPGDMETYFEQRQEWEDRFNAELQGIATSEVDAAWFNQPVMVEGQQMTRYAALRRNCQKGMKPVRAGILDTGMLGDYVKRRGDLAVATATASLGAAAGYPSGAPAGPPADPVEAQRYAEALRREGIVDGHWDLLPSKDAAPVVRVSGGRTLRQ